MKKLLNSTKNKKIIAAQRNTIIRLNKEIDLLYKRRSFIKKEISENENLIRILKQDAEAKRQIASGHLEQLGILVKENRWLKQKIMGLEAHVEYLNTKVKT